jgi:DNA-binding NarL/FixJ family response regulator
MSEMKHINVFIVDDHQIIRDGVKALLEREEEIKVVMEASNGQEALELIRKNQQWLDIILMDITMPVMDGVTATRQILKEFPLSNILGLSMHDDETHIIGMIQEGALGYVLKTTGKQELVHAITRVASGQSYFDKHSSEKILGFLSQKGERKKKMEASELTAREKEVLSLIAEEMTNTEIAEKLFLSPRTIDTHRRNLLQKLQVKNTAGLVKYAMAHQLK